MKTWLAGSFAALFLLAGCAVDPAGQHDRRVFDAIAAELEPGGPMYQISGTKYLFESLSRFPDRLGTLLLSHDLSPERRIQVAEGIKTGTEIILQSGLADLEGAGFSARMVEAPKGGAGPLFRARTMFLNGKPEAPGVLWNVLAAENRPLAEDFAALPANTLVASSVRLRLSPLLSSLYARSDVQKMLKEATTAPVCEQIGAGIDALDGDWVFALLDLSTEEKGTSAGIIILIPDTKGALAAMLELGAGAAPGFLARVDKGHYQLTLPDSIPFVSKPVILSGDGQIALYSSQETLDHFAASTKSLADTPEFQRLLKYVRREGNGFAYCSAKATPFFQELLLHINPEMAAPFPLSGTDMLRISSTLPNGLLLEECSGREPLQAFALTLMDFALLSIDEMIAEKVDTENAAIRAKADQDACDANIAAIAKALVQYMTKHNGNFPKESDLEGLRTLVREKYLEPRQLLCPAEDGTPAENAEGLSWENVSYLYFAGTSPQGVPTLPLLLESPYNHDTVNVLLLNGKGEKISLAEDEDPNFRKLVARLQSRYQYPEADFQRLFEAAAKLDRLLGE